MPFEPKIVPADDAQFDQRELALPDDLAALSEQLRDDALRLSACYPPGPVPLVVPAAPPAIPAASRGRKLLSAGSLAAGLASLGLCVMVPIYIAGRFGNESPKRGGSAPVVALDAAAPGFALPLSVAAPDSLVTPASFSGAMPPLTPAALGGGITGPEMEGWMDLRQDELAMDTESLEF